MAENLTLNQQNALHQRTYKAKKKAENPEEYRKKRSEEMKIYRAKRKEREAHLNLTNPQNTVAAEPKKTVELEPLENGPKRDKRGRPPNAEKNRIIPLFKRTNKPLEKSTKEDYLSKLNIINKLMLKQPLSDIGKKEIIKALENKQFYASVLEINMKYLRNIDDVVQKLRDKYQNDNTFRGYINPLVVILGKLPHFSKEYQQLAKLNIKLSNEYSAERDKHIVKEKDKNKLISFSPQEIKDGIEKLTNLSDKAIYVLSVYFLRRLEIRTLILSLEEDDEDNVLVVDKHYNPIKVIFNKYKTHKVYKQQSIDVPQEIKGILKDYLVKNKIKAGEYVLGQVSDRNKFVAQGNFSNKIKDVFNKIYNADITNRWIRQSYATHKNDDNFLEKMKEFEKDANLLSHSVAVHKQYVKNKK